MPVPEQPDVAFLQFIFSVRFVAKRYILQQMCLKKSMGSNLHAGTRSYNF